jgi:hypothetical protein
MMPMVLPSRQVDITTETTRGAAMTCAVTPVSRRGRIEKERKKDKKPDLELRPVQPGLVRL